MTINLTNEEAELICDLITEEQMDSEYEHYWDKNQRALFDEIVYKIKEGFSFG